jgi:hypothetical protein
MASCEVFDIHVLPMAFRALELLTGELEQRSSAKWAGRPS